MDYETKYKRALQIMKEVREKFGEDSWVQPKIIEAFPELKESKSEITRKKLLNYFVQLKKQNFVFYEDGLDVDTIVAWLEDQVEKKYSVFAEGSEVSNYHLTERAARELARKYKDEGYEDVAIKLI